MAKIKPRTFKGTHDFTPQEMIPRERLIQRIKELFRKYGFSPMETPALEMLEVLSGKYGEESDKLIYKLDYKNDRPHDRVALRYDLTVPLARVVASHPEWLMPFKRYQIQPVWRADQPQLRQGRFREFYQCDVDTIGAEEGLADAEIIALTVDLVNILGFTGESRQAVVLVNHRRLLESLCEFAGRPVSDLMVFCRALDKLDKIGIDGVREELALTGVTSDGFARMNKVFALEGTALEKLDALKRILPQNQATHEGIQALQNIFTILDALKTPSERLRLEPRLARGLDYYTGTVFETIVPQQPHLGSLAGGGRYDKLIGLYCGRDLPATGTTIGLDRIFAAMEQLNMIDMSTFTVTTVLLSAYSDEEIPAALKILTAMRDHDLAAELFPTTGKMKKPFTYADKMKIPYVAVVGPDEVADANNPKVALKDLRQGTQEVIEIAEAIRRIKAGMTNNTFSGITGCLDHIQKF